MKKIYVKVLKSGTMLRVREHLENNKDVAVNGISYNDAHKIRVDVENSGTPNYFFKSKEGYVFSRKPDTQRVLSFSDVLAYEKLSSWLNGFRNRFTNKKIDWMIKRSATNKFKRYKEKVLC